METVTVKKKKSTRIEKALYYPHRDFFFLCVSTHKIPHLQSYKEVISIQTQFKCFQVCAFLS